MQANFMIVHIYAVNQYYEHIRFRFCFVQSRFLQHISVKQHGYVVRNGTNAFNRMGHVT